MLRSVKAPPIKGRRPRSEEESHKGIGRCNVLESSLDKCRRPIALPNVLLGAIMPYKRDHQVPYQLMLFKC